MSSENVPAEQIALTLAELERRLLRPEVRRSPEELRHLLPEDFLEFGSSGKVYNREQIIAALGAEEPAPIAISELHCSLVRPDVALLTYRSLRQTGEGREALRSSLWVRRAEGWRLVFHQGTPIQ